MPAEGADWMPAPDKPLADLSDVAAEWVDVSALSGEKFLRMTAATAGAEWSRPIEWTGSGELRMQMRSRQQTSGAWKIIDAGGRPLAEGNLRPTTEWGNFLLQLPASVAGAQLVLTWDRPGSWDLRTLEFWSFDALAWRAEVKEREAGGLPQNLLPVSRFPLGLPQGWTVNRESSLGDELVLRADDTGTGPSGVPSLRIEALQAGWIRSPSYFAWPASESSGLPHRAAIRIRGTGSGELRCLEGTRVVARTPFVATDDWTTVTADFLPAAGETPLMIEIAWKEQTSGLWLDAVQVGPIGKAGAENPIAEFSGRGDAEVALAPTAYQGISFPGSIWSVQWFVTGAKPGAKLRWEVSDLYGQKVEGTLPLTPANGGGELALPVSGLSPAGSYRLNAWVVADGLPMSPVAEVILHRLPVPRFGFDRAPQSQFGVHVLPTRQHLFLAKAVGMNWVRLHGPGAEINYWFNVEPEPGSWRLRPELLERYRMAGFSVLGKFTSTPRWASGQKEVAHGYFDQFVSPKNLDQWKTYVAKLLEAYGSKVDIYEVWNEPWLDKFFSQKVERAEDGSHRYIGMEDPALAYAEMTRATRQALNAAAWQPPLIGLNSTTNQGVAGWIDGDEWTRRAEEAGALQDVQILSYHDYEQAATPVGQFAKTRERFAFALGPLLNKEGRSPRPVWNTEGSAQPEGMSPGLYRWLLPAPVDANATVWDEAERQARYILAQRTDGVEKIFLYTMHNSLGFAANNSFSVLLAPDGTLHPAGAALAALAQWIDGLDVLQHSRITLPAGGDLLLFGRKENPMVEVFLADAAGPVVCPPATAGQGVWHDLFGNPVDAVPQRGSTFFRLVSPEEQDATPATTATTQAPTAPASPSAPAIH